MSILDIFRKKVEEGSKQSPEQKLNNDLVIQRHQSRIDNLSEEFEILSKKLSLIELDIELPKTVKSKDSDTIISRMTLIKHEIYIREGLVNGFIDSRID